MASRMMAAKSVAKYREALCKTQRKGKDRSSLQHCISCNCNGPHLL